MQPAVEEAAEGAAVEELRFVDGEVGEPDADGQVVAVALLAIIFLILPADAEGVAAAEGLGAKGESCVSAAAVSDLRIACISDSLLLKQNQTRNSQKYILNEGSQCGHGGRCELMVVQPAGGGVARGGRELRCLIHCHGGRG